MVKNNLLQKNIPNGWQIKSFNDCFDVASKLQGLKKSDYKEQGKYPIIDQAQSFITGYTDSSSLLQEKIPTIIFGDHTRILKYIDFPYILGNDGTKIIWAKKENDPKFLFYSLLKLDIPNTGYNRHFKYLEQSIFSIPSKPEQEKIAYILSFVDEDIEKIEKIIEETERLKSGLAQKILVKSIRHTKFLKTKLGTIANISTGGTPKTTIGEYWNGDINWMASGEVHQKVVKFTEKNITKLGLENCNSEILLKGTVMMALAGQGKTRGTVAILDIETACNQSLSGIFTKDKKIILNEYIYYNLDSRYQELRNINGDKGRGGLNLQLLRDLDISFPEDVEEQKEIVKILSAVDKKISVNKKLKDKLTQLKKGLMSDLLGGKVRVN